MAINFLGYDVDKLKWGAKFGTVIGSKTYLFSTTSGAIQGSSVGGISPGYPWSAEIQTIIPTSISFQDINFSLTINGTTQNNPTIVPLFSEDFWRVRVSGYTRQPSRAVDGSLQCDYSSIGETVLGKEINTLYFNNRLVYSNSIFSYSLLDDDTYEISYAGGLSEGATLVLPSTYNDKPITRIGDFYGCPASIVKVPAGYTIINDWAFETAWLKELYLPDTLEYIYEYAFCECTSLQKVAMQGCISVSNNAFDTCTALEYFAFPNNQVHIGSNVFDYCHNLKYIYIPESVLDIDGPMNSAVWSPRVYCAAQQSGIVITSSVGSGAQGWYEEWNEGCPYVYYDWKVPTQHIHYKLVGDNKVHISWSSSSKLPTKLCIPVIIDGCLVTGIENGGFIGKNIYNEDISAEEIRVPHSVEYFGDGAFEQQQSLSFFEFQSEKATLGAGILYLANNLSGLSAPFIGKTATSLGNDSVLGVFFDTRSTINNQGDYVPDSLETIAINSDWSPGPEQYSIRNCQYVFDFMLSDSVTTLYADAFYNCGLQSFPVNQQYWRWELLDDNTKDVVDYGGLDTVGFLNTALSKLKDGTWDVCYVHEPEVPNYNATRSGNKVILVISNQYPQKVKYATAYQASYAYGPGQASKSPDETGEIPAYGNVTATYTFPSTNSTGASLTGITSRVWFNDYQSKTVTKNA